MASVYIRRVNIMIVAIEKEEHGGRGQHWPGRGEDKETLMSLGIMGVKRGNRKEDAVHRFRCPDGFEVKVDRGDQMGGMIFCLSLCRLTSWVVFTDVPFVTSYQQPRLMLLQV